MKIEMKHLVEDSRKIKYLNIHGYQWIHGTSNLRATQFQIQFLQTKRETERRRKKSGSWCSCPDRSNKMVYLSQSHLINSLIHRYTDFLLPSLSKPKWGINKFSEIRIRILRFTKKIHKIYRKYLSFSLSHSLSHTTFQFFSLSHFQS